MPMTITPACGEHSNEKRKGHGSMTGHEFQRRRKALGYSSRDKIALALGVSPSTVQRWESTKRSVPVIAALALQALAAGLVI
jgi:DNA-binding transcriptional regulator YiaG